MSDFDKYTLVPGYSTLDSRDDVDLSTSITDNLSVKYPLIASPMSSVCESEMAIAIAKAGGVGAIHRYMTLGDQAIQVHKVKFEGLPVGASVSTDISGVDLLVAGHADFVIFDVAHGDSKPVLEAAEKIRKQYSIPIVSGNIVTWQAAGRWLDIGVNVLRVGLGSGSACTTREVAGVGRNQIDAIREIRDTYKTKATILSCGGIRNSGDIVKALAAGADAVIIGRMFAGCEESPARNTSRYDVVRYSGMASQEAEEGRVARTGEDPTDIIHLRMPEGKSEWLAIQGPVKDVVARLVTGVKIGFAYVGARNIQELQRLARFE